MDIRTRYDIGCHLYMIRDDGKKAGVEVATIVNIVFAPIGTAKTAKCDVHYDVKDRTGAFWRIQEKNINHSGAVYDNREQAYQAACKLIDSDIERQLDVIRKGEKV